MRLHFWCALLASLLLPLFAQADPPKLRFSGFGSVVAGKLTSGSDYLADFQSVGLYDKELSFDPDSKFGLQMDANLQQGLSATVQVLARGSNAFEPHFDWAYASYELTPTWTLQAGRKRLPLYYYSDFFDVAYTYKWIRPPADAYSLNFISYNGANLLYLNNWGDWDMIGNLYVGREHTARNELWEFILPRLTANTAFPITPGTTFETDYRNMVGGSLQGSYDWLKLRGTYLRGEVVQLRNKNLPSSFLAFNDAPFVFYGVAVVVAPGPLEVIGEFTNFSQDIDRGSNLPLKIDFDAWYVTASYRIGKTTPHLTYSQFKDFDDAQKHDTVTIGVRCDFHPAAAAKLEYTQYNDNGSGHVSEDAKLVAAGLDFVF